MTLLQQYIDKALAVIAKEWGDEYTDALGHQHMANHGAYPREGDNDLTHLAALVMVGSIRHIYDGGCPDTYKDNLESPTFDCDDSGCVACLIQRDWLTMTLRPGDA